eukprot:GHUV01025389.1.p1 GENE.GHUV01025389.1~~GHUV01025389.1.p1  ORF type:complete len:611 (+),score=132.24 GHUV01025389.1:251-2083(+)
MESRVLQAHAVHSFAHLPNTLYQPSCWFHLASIYCMIIQCVCESCHNTFRQPAPSADHVSLLAVSVLLTPRSASTAGPAGSPYKAQLCYLPHKLAATHCLIVSAGRAMVWFANQHLAVIMYSSLAVSVLLTPWSHMDYSQGRGKQLLPYHVLGGALVNSVIGAVLTRFGVGLSMIFALWGGAGTLTGFCVAQGLSVTTLSGALVACAWPIYTCGETAVVMAIVLMSRMSLTGHVFVGLGDTIVGFMLGLGAISITGCSLLPILQATLGRHSRKLAAVLAATAVAAAVVCSLEGIAVPYSKDMPKRLMLGHVHYTAPADGMQRMGEGPVPMTVLNSSWVIASSDSNPAAMLAAAMGFNLSEAQKHVGNEWGVIYPVSKLLDFELFPSQPALGVVQELPYVRSVGQRSIQHHHRVLADAAGQRHTVGQETGHLGGAGSADRCSSAVVDDQLRELQLEVFTAKPCWGTLKLSGVDLVSWSITPGEWTDAASFIASEQEGSGRALISRKAEGISADEEDWGDGGVRSIVVKWTSEHRDGPLHWPLKLRFSPKQQAAGQPAGAEKEATTEKSGLVVELHVGYVEKTAALAEMEARMPEWSTLSFEATTYISKWEF